MPWIGSPSAPGGTAAPGDARTPDRPKASSLVGPDVGEWQPANPDDLSPYAPDGAAAGGAGAAAPVYLPPEAVAPPTAINLQPVDLPSGQGPPDPAAERRRRAGGLAALGELGEAVAGAEVTAAVIPGVDPDEPEVVGAVPGRDGPDDDREPPDRPDAAELLREDGGAWGNAGPADRVPDDDDHVPVVRPDDDGDDISGWDDVSDSAWLTDMDDDRERDEESTDV